MYQEKNTGTNLPAQIDIFSKKGNSYDFLFIAKGGGSANKTYLYQQTKALLNKDKLSKFINEKIKTLGTAACPPYHLAVVIGGLSAELTLKTVKLASTKYLDDLPTSGNEHGRAFRDVELENEIFRLTQQTGIGAQFGGKYFCHDVRVVRLPRHGASCPVGIGVSCSADRQIIGKINSEGVFLEQLETNPGKYLPDVMPEHLGGDVIKINLNQGMNNVLAELNRYPIKTRISLTGTLIVARDIAHAKYFIFLISLTKKLMHYILIDLKRDLIVVTVYHNILKTIQYTMQVQQRHLKVMQVVHLGQQHQLVWIRM